MNVILLYMLYLYDGNLLIKKNLYDGNLFLPETYLVSSVFRFQISFLVLELIDPLI
jgi:hypothetical protein